MWVLFLVSLTALSSQPDGTQKFMEERVTSYGTFQECERDRIRLVQHAEPLKTYRCGKAEDNALGN